MANQKTGDTTLTDLRKSCGMLQREVAERMGVNRQRIGQIEGAYPEIMLPVLMAYMKAIGGQVELGAGDVRPVLADEVVASPSRKASVRYYKSTKNYEALRTRAEDHSEWAPH